jgi:hypothetical protein
VLENPDEYESWRDTAEIHSDLDLMDEIKKGLLALKTESKLYTLEELL